MAAVLNRLLEGTHMSNLQCSHCRRAVMLSEFLGLHTSFVEDMHCIVSMYIIQVPKCILRLGSNYKYIGTSLDVSLVVLKSRDDVK